jgi:hypothetical protein
MPLIRDKKVMIIRSFPQDKKTPQRFYKITFYDWYSRSTFRPDNISFKTTASGFSEIDLMSVALATFRLRMTLLSSSLT